MNENLLKVIKDMKHNSLQNYIVPGLVSSLVGGGEYGKVRLFEANRATREFITPHSHRFDFTCIVLQGVVVNSIFQRSTLSGSEAWCQSTINQVCGADGRLDYVHVREAQGTMWISHAHQYHAGDIYHMHCDQVHSIAFERGAKVLFFEGPEKTPNSIMLEPWENGKVVPTFRVEEWMFEKHD